MWRRGAVLVAALVPLLAVVVPATAQRDPATEAAEQIAEAQDRADLAAAAWVEAAERLEELETAEAAAAAELAGLEARLEEVRVQVEQVILQRFMSASVTGLPFLSGFQRPTDLAQAEVLLEIVTETAVVDLDDLVATSEQVSAARRRLGGQREATERARQQYETASTVAQAEVERLQRAEQQRQRNVAVQRAYELQRASRARQETVGGTLEADRAMRRGGTAVFGSAGWRCPVAGPTAFGDTWGAPRPGDRRHLGTDFISPRGTPLVAVVSGVATSGQNRLGGNVVYLVGDDGHRYYYAHLDRWGTLGRVAAGDVIGYVGDTGNAVGVPHLHFEIRPGGGPNVNPYATVRMFC